MQYYKISTGKFIQYDETTERAVVLIEGDLQVQKQMLQEKIAASDSNQMKTAEDWIVWAKEYYPQLDRAKEVSELKEINEKLLAIKHL